MRSHVDTRLRLRIQERVSVCASVCACMPVSACSCLSVRESWWLGQLELGLGWEEGRDDGRASLFGHPPNLIFSNPKQARGLKINTVGSRSLRDHTFQQLIKF